MSSFYDIAIVGGGASGTLLAAQLARQSASPLRIALIEPRLIPGQGAAYSASSVHLLLNVPASKMSAFPAQPNHFHDWLSTHLLQPVEGNAFVPRRLYGYYLENLYRSSLASAAAGFQCDHLKTEALDLEYAEDKKIATLLLKNGVQIRAKKVVLALGNLPGEYPLRKALPFYKSTRYVHQPWQPGALEDIRPGDTVLLVGAGLTAADITVLLLNSRHEGQIHSLSRHGFLSQPHNPTKPWDDQWLRKPRPLNARLWLRKIKQEIARARDLGSDWRAVLDSMRPFSQEIWQELPQAGRLSFLRHLRPYWEIHRHRLAPAIARQLENAKANRRFFIHGGRILSFDEKEEAVHVLFRGRKTGEVRELIVHHVINCTGPRPDITKFQHPLLVNLLASGLIYHDPLALGINATPAGEVIGFRRPPSDWLFTLGTPMKGILWESTSIPEIRVQAKDLAAKLLLNDRTSP